MLHYDIKQDVSATHGMAGEVLLMEQDEIAQLRADAGTVVHALNCSMQLIDALIVFLPEGQPMHPRVATAKNVLDEAMGALRVPRDPAADEIQRLKTSLNMACSNLARISEQRDKLTQTLNAALKLVDACLNEVARLPNLPMALVVGRDQFKKAMDHLLEKPRWGEGDGR
jgi:methyl-accepting chemotaxis protein